MADYKRKRRRTGRSYTKKRSYLPNLGGGGYSGPRNYFRTHDFRYEKEQSAKPPRTETRYEVIERPSTESHRQPTFYRPELDQAALENSVGHAIERYLRNESEQKRELQYQAETRLESETPPNLQEAGLEAKALETGIVAIEEKAPKISSTEPLVEISQEANPVIGKGAELYESYELPVNDLELLLVELDASPFEGADWEGTREDLELLWNLREALSRSVEKGQMLPEQPDPVTELEPQSSELLIKDAELLLAELGASQLGTEVDQKTEKIENAERSL